MLDRNAKRDAAALRILLDVANEQRINPTSILIDTDLNVDNVYSHQAEIEVWQELRAIENLREIEAPLSLAIESASRLHITTLGALGYAMLSSFDIRSALEIAAKFHSISLWLCDVTTEARGNVVEFFVLPHTLPESCRDFCSIRGVASLKVWVSELLGRNIAPLSVQLRTPKPQDSDLYDSFFDTRIEYGAEVYKISFERSLFREPLKLADPWNRQRSEEELKAIKSRREATFANQVRELILINPKKNQSEDTVARSLKISGSTLRRRLKEEGTTFREVRAETLHALARVMLIGSPRNIDEIADQLGYSEAASFVRSFRRIEGIAPGAWRKAEREQH
tara:strand:+ start:7400 stop:8413 length:1014 start_codon:yes stop_codon:yes gene_type:complete